MGLILAAGFGTRHTPIGDGIPKPLLPVAGRALILRTIDGLAVAGCQRIVVVLGYRSDEIRTFLDNHYDGPMDVVTVVNERFQMQNGVSVLAARDEISGSFVLSMADHVFDPTVMELLRHTPFPERGASVVVDSKLDAVLDIDDATKVQTEAGRVRRIGKDLVIYDAVDCGIFLGGTDLFDALKMSLDGFGDTSLSQGVQTLADMGMMECIDLGDAWWQDVDTPNMLEAAEQRLRDRALRHETGARRQIPRLTD